MSLLYVTSSMFCFHCLLLADGMESGQSDDVVVRHQRTRPPRSSSKRPRRSAKAGRLFLRACAWYTPIRQTLTFYEVVTIGAVEVHPVFNCGGNA